MADLLRKLLDSKETTVVVDHSNAKKEYFYETCIPKKDIENAKLLCISGCGGATATGYEFKKHKGIRCLALKLMAHDGFRFNVYFPLQKGLNGDLLKLLEAVHAFRISDESIDFKRLMDYEYQYDFEKNFTDGQYYVQKVSIVQESYGTNINYDPNPILENIKCK